MVLNVVLAVLSGAQICASRLETWSSMCAVCGAFW